MAAQLRSSRKKPKLPTIQDLDDNFEDSASLRTASSSSSAYGGYASSRTSLGSDFDKQGYRRVPDHKHLFETIILSSGGRVEVHDHKKAGFLAAEPRASEATHEDYMRTQFPTRRRRVSGESSASSQTAGALPNTIVSLEKKDFLEGSPTWGTAVHTVQYPVDRFNDEPSQYQRSATDSLYLDQTEAPSDDAKKFGRLTPLDENKESKPELNPGDHESSQGSERIETMSSPSESEGGSESEQTGTDSTSNEICTDLEDLELNEEHIVTPILDTAGQAMVERIMTEFWLIFNQRWPSNVRQHGGYSQGSEALGGVTLTHSTSAPRALQKKRQRKEDEEDDAGSNGNHQPPNGFISSPNEPADPLQFACPFRKHDPCHYSVYTHRSCALSHWPSIARVKEHLYRTHQMKLHCERCWQIFDKQEDLRAHRILDRAEMCQVRPGHPPDGLRPEIERRLRSRKKAHRDQTDDDRWRDMYQLLFPNEDVPSPYFEPLQEEAPSSPDSRDLAQYEEYARRELPRLVRASVLEVFSREMQPVEASLIANLVETIQECQARMFRSYSERMIYDQPGDAALDSMEDALSIPPLPYSVLFPSHQYRIDEENSMHTPATFLNAAFQQPPPVQRTGTEPGFQIHDLMHSFEDSHPVDASLSSLSEALFTDNGHGSEYTSTTVSSQSQAAESACPPREPNFQDDVLWRDWASNPY